MRQRSAAHPRYRQLAQILRQELAARRYAIGESFPRVRELAARHHCSLTTVQQALRELRREALLESTPRGGIRVRAFPASDGRSGRVVFVFPQWDTLAEESFAAQLMLGVSVSAGQAGFVVETRPYRELAELDGLRDQLRRDQPAGVIWANAPDPVLATQFEDAGIRLVTLIRHDPRVSCPYTADAFDAAFDGLLADWKRRGLRRPGILAMGNLDPTYEPVLQLLLAKLAAAGLAVPPDHLCRARTDGLDRREETLLLADFLARSGQMDAIYAFTPDVLGDLLALAAKQKRPLHESHHLVLQSIRAAPLPPAHALLESDLQAHARAAIHMLRDWLNTGVRPAPVRIPLSWRQLA
ncbi:MAG: GntR family transcriptional regulator [Lentisphaeria bacterium]